MTRVWDQDQGLGPGTGTSDWDRGVGPGSGTRLLFVDCNDGAFTPECVGTET